MRPDAGLLVQRRTAGGSAGRPAVADTATVRTGDREWNEGAARARLVRMFEAVGLEDPWAVATRRKLSTILFG